MGGTIATLACGCSKREEADSSARRTQPEPLECRFCRHLTPQWVPTDGCRDRGFGASRGPAEKIMGPGHAGRKCDGRIFGRDGRI